VYWYSVSPRFVERKECQAKENRGMTISTVSFLQGNIVPRAGFRDGAEWADGFFHRSQLHFLICSLAEWINAKNKTLFSGQLYLLFG
jgi:hypothetical protein